MLSLFNKQRPNHLTALVPQPQGLCVAGVRHHGGQRPTLLNCEFTPWAESDQTGLIQEKVKQYRLDRSPCTSLIQIGDYTILNVEAPDVPPAELRAAIRWRIKDLIDFHIDDAVLDVYDAPPSGSTGKQNNLYVVVTHQSTIQKQADLLHAADANLDMIDIPELVMRNIAALLPEDDGGVALIHLARDNGLITITRQSTLYLGRTLDLGYDQLGQHAGDADGLAGSELLTNPAYDRLVLELQRSLDYYDRYFGQPPIAAIYLSPLETELPGLHDYLTQNLGISSRSLDLNQLLECDRTLDPHTQAQCMLAIGAALRQEQKSL